MRKNETELFRKIQDEAFELFKRKNADYGSVYAEYGVVGGLIRIEDKIKRFRTISKNKIELVQDEKLRDTLIDAQNYINLCLLILDNPEENK